MVNMFSNIVGEEEDRQTLNIENCTLADIMKEIHIIKDKEIETLKVLSTLGLVDLKGEIFHISHVVFVVHGTIVKQLIPLLIKHKYTIK